MYTTTSEVIARLGVLEKNALALLDEVKLMQADLIDNGRIIYESELEHDAHQEAQFLAEEAEAELEITAEINNRKIDMYRDASEQERYFKFNTILLVLVAFVITLGIVLGTVSGQHTGNNTHQTSIACINAGGSWVYNTTNDANKWECHR